MWALTADVYLCGPSQSGMESAYSSNAILPINSVHLKLKEQWNTTFIYNEFHVAKETLIFFVLSLVWWNIPSTNK